MINLNLSTPGAVRRLLGAEKKTLYKLTCTACFAIRAFCWGVSVLNRTLNILIGFAFLDILCICYVFMNVKQYSFATFSVAMW